MAAQGRPLPDYVRREFDDYLQCGRLEQGFLRVRCEFCHAEHLVAFSCKRRGFCPSCGARRMAESAALLVDEVFPEQPVRRGRVLSPGIQCFEIVHECPYIAGVSLPQCFDVCRSLVALDVECVGRPYEARFGS